MSLSLRYSYWEVCRMYHYYSCNSLRPTSKNNQEFCNHAGCVHTLRSKSVSKPKAEVDTNYWRAFAIQGPFLESPNNYSGPKRCFMFVVFAFKIKVSIILKIIRWNYETLKQDSPVGGQGTVLLFNRFWFKICLRTRKVTRPFEKQVLVLYSEGPQ